MSGMKLKPCPFCGAELIIGKQRIASCKTEGCMIQHRAVDLDYPKHIAAWNRRTPDPRVKALVEALNGCIVAIEHANMADGVCCCGDNMEGHSEPMNCGHSPVDMGEYHAHQVLIAARAALRARGQK